MHVKPVSFRALAAALLPALAVVAGCELEQGWPWVRNMFDSPGPQLQEAALQPPEHTVPTAGGELIPPFEVEEEEAPENPERSNDSPEARARGRTLYERFCGTCHGPDAKGRDLTEDFENDDLTEEGATEMSDGEIFNLLVEGGLSMPHYRAEIVARDRWLVINHFRRLQGNR